MTRKKTRITIKAPVLPAANGEAVSVSTAREVLRAAKMRCTPSRVAVFLCLAASDKPLSHVEAAVPLTPLGFDHSTIYRCLVDLAEAGLVARVDLGDHVWRFSLASGHASHSADHPHFICVGCGKATCLPGVSVQFTAPRGKRSPLLSGVTEVLLKGRCGDCQ